MHKQLKGIYGPFIKEFINFKRSVGFKFNTEEKVLNLFDIFTVERKESIVGITRELSEAWCNSNLNDSDLYRHKKVSCLNQLSGFLNHYGISSYIAQLPVAKYNFTPYIFSREEMAKLFQACDDLESQIKVLDSVIMIVPALIRVLYGTGLRISEALSMLDQDVNTDEGYIRIRVENSKNGRERNIPLSKSLGLICDEYRNNRNRLPIKIPKDTPFFTSLNGSICKYDTITKWFKKVVCSAGIKQDSHGPTLHSLRHSFSVHSLSKMVESGIDLYCALPILSTFLGHQSLEATNAYVRLTAEMFPGLIHDIDMQCLNVFPNYKNQNDDKY